VERPAVCKVCGVGIRDFLVTVDVWEVVIGAESKTVCYNCFCDACDVAGVDSMWELRSLGEDDE